MKSPGIALILRVLDTGQKLNTGVVTTRDCPLYCHQNRVLPFMTALAKKQGISVPETIARKAGIRPGDLVEFTVRQGTITIHAAPQHNESRYPLYTPTKTEAAAIRRGRTDYKRGEFVTLDQLHKELDAARRQRGKKVTRELS